MLVEGELALAFKALLFGSDLHVALNLHTLRQQFLKSASSADLLHCRLRLVDQSGAESAKTNLDECSVVEDLCADICNVDCLLEM